jgi:hypothetical protein
VTTTSLTASGLRPDLVAAEEIWSNTDRYRSRIDLTNSLMT